jgi:hypothetical protein
MAGGDESGDEGMAAPTRRVESKPRKGSGVAAARGGEDSGEVGSTEMDSGCGRFLE